MSVNTIKLDFIFKDYIFEVGGKSKGFKQIKNQKGAFLVKEELGVGEGEISLYLFGLLY